jgi:hypothetical protein
MVVETPRVPRWIDRAWVRDEMSEESGSRLRPAKIDDQAPTDLYNLDTAR